MKCLDDLLSTLQQQGLKARPSKVELGFSELEYLGFMVGGGKLQPVSSKVSKILQVAIPTTKKQVRAFLGCTSFYRRFVPSYSTISAPLVELTKKKNLKSLTGLMTVKQHLTNYALVCHLTLWFSCQIFQRLLLSVQMPVPRGSGPS